MGDYILIILSKELAHMMMVAEKSHNRQICKLVVQAHSWCSSSINLKA